MNAAPAPIKRIRITNLVLNGVRRTSTSQSIVNAVAPMGFHPATSSAPIQTPANSDTNTCRVVIASTIANNGGASARMPKCSVMTIVDKLHPNKSKYGQALKNLAAKIRFWNETRLEQSTTARGGSADRCRLRWVAGEGR